MAEAVRMRTKGKGLARVSSRKGLARRSLKVSRRRSRVPQAILENRRSKKMVVRH